MIVLLFTLLSGRATVFQLGSISEVEKKFTESGLGDPVIVRCEFVLHACNVD